MINRSIIMFISGVVTGGIAGYLIGKKKSGTMIVEKEPEYIEAETVKEERELAEEQLAVVQEYVKSICKDYTTPASETVIKPWEEELKKNDIREITEAEFRTSFEDSNFVYLKFFKDTNELFDDRDQEVFRPRVILGDIWDGLEARTDEQIYVRNDRTDTVYSIDIVE